MVLTRTMCRTPARLAASKRARLHSPFTWWRRTSSLLPMAAAIWIRTSAPSTSWSNALAWRRSPRMTSQCSLQEGKIPLPRLRTRQGRPALSAAACTRLPRKPEAPVRAIRGAAEYVKNRSSHHRRNCSPTARQEETSDSRSCSCARRPSRILRCEQRPLHRPSPPGLLVCTCVRADR